MIHHTNISIKTVLSAYYYKSFKVSKCLIMTVQMMQMCIVYRPHQSKANKFTVNLFLSDFCDFLGPLVTFNNLLIFCRAYSIGNSMLCRIPTGLPIRSALFYHGQQTLSLCLHWLKITVFLNTSQCSSTYPLICIPASTTNAKSYI